MKRQIKSKHKRALINQLNKIDNISDFYDVLVSNNILNSKKRFLQVETDISNVCNLRCRMCYFSLDKYFYQKPVFMLPQTFHEIGEQIFDFTQSLTLSLGNEPLTSPYFTQLLKISSKFDIPEINFSTNGILLDKKIIDAVIQDGVTEVRISIDGANSRTFETIRRGASFKKLLRNIEDLEFRKKELGSSTPEIRIDIVMMEQNVSELEDIVTLASKIGATKLNFCHMVVYKGLGMESESLVNNKELSNYWLGRARSKAKELGLTVILSPNDYSLASTCTKKRVNMTGIISALRQNPTHYMKHTIRYLNGFLMGKINNHPVFQNRLYCSFPFFHISMNAGGNILACPFSHNQRPMGTLSLGVSFENVWLGKKFNHLRKRILNKNPLKMCKQCSFLALDNPNIKAFNKPRRP